MAMNSGRGGRRQNAGRKTEVPGEVMERHNVMLDDTTRRKLLVLGDGNLSRGIRRAACVAFERYQRQK
jgi:hypothetical protein